MTRVERRDVVFESAGARCAAWLYLPAGAPPFPCVVMGHGFGGTRDAGLPAFAERFAAAGLAALVFDYRHFGASEGEPRQLALVPRQLEDWRAALALARSLPEVDAARVALWGTSFSGGHVLRVAADDGRVAAVVSQVPFCDGRAGAASPRSLLPLLGRALRDAVAGRLGLAPVLVPVVGPPGSVAALTSPDSEPGYLALVPPGSPWRNAVAARVVLQIGRYRPGLDAARIACPLLVCVADRDVVTPPGPALAAAARAPKGTVKRYDCQHFEVYAGPHFERAARDQLAFLADALRPGAAAR